MWRSTSEKNHIILSVAGLLFLTCYFIGLFYINNLHQDGLVYSTISRNMSIGLGSAWKPAYSQFQYSKFYEHPGLGLWIGSLFFKLLGDHSYTEKIFSSLVALINFSWLVFYWRKYTNTNVEIKHLWIVLLGWSVIPLFIFYYPSNSLKMLANAFALPTIHFLMCSLIKTASKMTTLFYQCLSALLLMLSFLIGGPLTLFPLVFYLCHYFIFRRYKFAKYMTLTLQLVAMCSIILCFFFYLVPDAYQNFKNYLDIQLFASLNGKRQDLFLHGLDRIKIVRMALNQFILLFMITIATLWLYKNTYKTSLWDNYIYTHFYNKNLLLFFTIGLTALLPIMISPKQYNHYALQSCFFFDLCFLMIITPALIKLTNSINTYKILIPLITILSIGFIAFFESKLQANKIINNIYIKIYETMDPQNINIVYRDSRKIGEYLLNKTNVISIPDYDYNRTPRVINTYLMRRYKISVAKTNHSPYLMTDKRLLKYSHYTEQVQLLLKNASKQELLLDLGYYRLYKLS